MRTAIVTTVAIEMATTIATASDPFKDSAALPYVGMWVTADGYIRHELLPGGRYDEARGKRRSAYQGQYWIKIDYIEYLDDTGFTANGDFGDGVHYHGGMVL